MMGQTIGRSVKTVAPDWLIDELKRDVHYVTRKFNVAKDVAFIDICAFKGYVV